jgi:tRNA dimethylallyltransferase
LTNLQPSTSNLQPLLLAGPTAVGKSEIAMRLAEKLSGEIVSVDSMQVYRGMDIGTAKPSVGERTRVPHHLIDVVEVTETFNAVQFIRLARAALSEIQARGRVPILVGGTGFYFAAFLEGLGAAPPADAALRATLQTTPLSDLLRELAERDPVTYERIDRQNPRRVIRAMEVIRLTGKPFSEQCAHWQPSTLDPLVASKRSKDGRRSTQSFALTRATADLRQRIDARVEEMFRRGLVAETDQLLKRGLAENMTAMQALGYRQVAEHLRGERSLAETVELVKIRTRQFAKRQMTWFRKQADLKWIQVEANESDEAVVERLLHA